MQVPVFILQVRVEFYPTIKLTLIVPAQIATLLLVSECTTLAINLTPKAIFITKLTLIQPDKIAMLFIRLNPIILTLSVLI